MPSSLSLSLTLSLFCCGWESRLQGVIDNTSAKMVRTSTLLRSSHGSMSSFGVHLPRPHPVRLCSITPPRTVESLCLDSHMFADLTLASLKTKVTSILNDTNCTPPELLCARSFLHLDEAVPFTIGYLPLPAGTARTHGVVIRASRTLSPEHVSLLKARFHKEWLPKVQEMITTVPHMVSYDVFNDSACTIHLGSFVITKYAALLKTEHVSCISINSFVSCTDRDGVGTTMLNIIKDLLFEGTTDVVTGYMFAQCLNLDFWITRLFESQHSYSLHIQMRLLYGSMNRLYRECTMRSARVER